MTKHAIALTLMLALGLVTLTAQAAHGQTTDERALLERQSERYAAAMAQDLDRLAPMVAENLRYCHTTGAVDTKTSYLETVRSGGIRWLDVNPEGMEARVYGDVGVIAGRLRQQITVAGRDQPIDMYIRTVEVYLKRDGRWQLSEFQASNVR